MHGYYKHIGIPIRVYNSYLIKDQNNRQAKVQEKKHNNKKKQKPIREFSEQQRVTMFKGQNERKKLHSKRTHPLIRVRFFFFFQRKILHAPEGVSVGAYMVIFLMRF